MRFLQKTGNALKKKYPDFEDFRRNYKVPEEIIENILSEAKKALKDKYPKDEEKKTTELLKQMLRALAARDLWDMNEYFKVFNPTRDIYKKGLEIIRQDDYDKYLVKPADND